jgi:hypothetical protein
MGTPTDLTALKGIITKSMLLPLLLITANALATEVDSITVRTIAEDATEVLNEEMNRRIGKAIKKANRWGQCSERRLYRALGDRLRAGPEGFFLVAPLENFANWNRDVPKKGVPRSESIYSRVRVHESVPITLYPLGKVLRLNESIIAGDKFSHFFNVGWTYYNIHYVDEKPVTVALDYGSTTERLIWGLLTTGVYSWADLSANFSGMRFWASVLGEPDVLHRELPPLVKCESSNWVQNRQFSWTNWVSAAWDEGVNCNTYAPRFADKIEEVNELRVAEGLEVCPIQPEACPAITKAAGPFANNLIHPICAALQ